MILEDLRTLMGAHKVVKCERCNKRVKGLRNGIDTALCKECQKGVSV